MTTLDPCTIQGLGRNRPSPRILAGHHMYMLDLRTVLGALAHHLAPMHSASHHMRLLGPCTVQCNLRSAPACIQPLRLLSHVPIITCHAQACMLYTISASSNWLVLLAGRFLHHLSCACVRCTVPKCRHVGTADCIAVLRKESCRRSLNFSAVAYLGIRGVWRDQTPGRIALAVGCPSELRSYISIML